MKNKERERGRNIISGPRPLLEESSTIPDLFLSGDRRHQRFLGHRLSSPLLPLKFMVNRYSAEKLYFSKLESLRIKKNFFSNGLSNTNKEKRITRTEV